MERGLIAPRPVKHRLRDEVARGRPRLLGLAGWRKSGARSAAVARGHRDHWGVPLVVLSCGCAAQRGPGSKGGPGFSYFLTCGLVPDGAKKSGHLFSLFFFEVRNWIS